MNVTLIAFLYHLLRDALPSGEVERLMLEAEKITPRNQAVYSNAHLAAYASELAGRLVPGDGG